MCGVAAFDISQRDAIALIKIIINCCRPTLSSLFCLSQLGGIDQLFSNLSLKIFKTLITLRTFQQEIFFLFFSSTLIFSEANTRPLQSCIVRNLNYTDSCLLKHGKNKQQETRLLNWISPFLFCSFRVSRVSPSEREVVKCSSPPIELWLVFLRLRRFTGRKHFSVTKPAHFYVLELLFYPLFINRIINRSKHFPSAMKSKRKWLVLDSFVVPKGQFSDLIDSLDRVPLIKLFSENVHKFLEHFYLIRKDKRKGLFCLKWHQLDL